MKYFPGGKELKLLSADKDLIFGVSLHLHAYFEVCACEQRRLWLNYVDLLACLKY